MTSFDAVQVKCKCGHVFTSTYPLSICTWLSPDLVEQLLEGTLFVAHCEECGENYKIDTEVLMNTPRGMCRMPSIADPELIKEFLVKFKVISEEGKVYSSEEQRRTVRNE
ncbi:MAG: CpXC domain-containing protein [Candidatus Heimdallarchaeota archaeon]